MCPRVCWANAGILAELYEQLKEESSKSGVPATAFVREALTAWLRARKRRALKNGQLMDYAANEAGSPSDLDFDLESAAIATLDIER